MKVSLPLKHEFFRWTENTDGILMMMCIGILPCTIIVGKWMACLASTELHSFFPLLFFLVIATMRSAVACNIHDVGSTSLLSPVELLVPSLSVCWSENVLEILFLMSPSTTAQQEVGWKRKSYTILSPQLECALQPFMPPDYALFTFWKLPSTESGQWPMSRSALTSHIIH